MAKRPVFAADKRQPYYREWLVDFEFFPGFSVEQKRKSILSLHDNFHKRNQSAKVLEISSKSTVPLGVGLSAFNLIYTDDAGKKHTVETVFQSSKKFANGGPYTDLLKLPSYLAKKDERLKNSGRLVSFEWNGYTFPLEPKTFFYDWIYVNAIAQNADIGSQLAEYDAFTDIEFNPQKSINCQARSCAIYVSLVRCGLLSKALKSPDAFCEIVYVKQKEDKQLSFFDV